MSTEMKNEHDGKHRDNSSGLEFMSGIKKQDYTLLKKAFLISLILHGLLLMIVLPAGEVVLADLPPDVGPIPIPTSRPPQPEPPDKNTILIKVNFPPIPDPTPEIDEPQDYIFDDYYERDPMDEGEWLHVPVSDQQFHDGVNVEKVTCYERTKAAYPELARKAHIEGVVVMRVIFDTNGRIKQPRVLQSPGAQFGFEAAALEAVKKWRCHPAMLDGRKVEMIGTVSMIFKLN